MLCGIVCLLHVSLSHTGPCRAGTIELPEVVEMLRQLGVKNYEEQAQKLSRAVVHP
jgi:hypothetical protein